MGKWSNLPRITHLGRGWINSNLDCLGPTFVLLTFHCVTHCICCDFFMLLISFCWIVNWCSANHGPGSTLSFEFLFSLELLISELFQGFSSYCCYRPLYCRKTLNFFLLDRALLCWHLTAELLVAQGFSNFTVALSPRLRGEEEGWQRGLHRKSSQAQSWFEFISPTFNPNIHTLLLNLANASRLLNSS